MLEKSPVGSAEGLVPVTEERLEVGRRTVETGAVRARKRVHEETGQVSEPLVTEYVDAQRVPIGRVLQDPVGIRQEGDVTIVPVIEERLVVRKELVLVEEIRLTRRREVHEATEQVKLRRESVIVERFDPETQQWLSQDGG
jgi:uncharacterized protein (TIGR02271 family)